MALTLPTSFKNHIQNNRDTNLVPLVIINQSDNAIIYLSTNDIVISSMRFKPILLNIPGLKENIDIQGRSYRIGNISLSISNAPYEGVRFSETAINSLVNSSVHIYWYVPGTNFMSAMLMYSGKILRYEHDSEKVKLSVEDKSQVKMHRELPSTDTGTGSSTGAASYLPDRYKNQKIPFVYGAVERSPVMPYYGIKNPSASDIDRLLELRLRADTKEIEFITGEKQIGSTTLPISTLYFYDNQSYWNVAETTAELNATSDITNFTTETSSDGSDIVLDVDNSGYVATEEAMNNDFSTGRLRIFYVRSILRTEYKEFIYNESEIVADLFPENINLGRIYGTQDLNVPFNLSEGWQNYNYGWYKCYIDILSEPLKATSPTTWIFLNVTHYNYSTTSYSPDGTVNDDFSGLQDPRTKWAVWAGGSSNIQWTTGLNNQEGWSYSNALNGRYYWTHYNNINSNGDNAGEVIELKNDDGNQVFSTLSLYDYVNIGIPGGLADSSIAEDVTINVDFTLNDAFLVHQFFVEGVADKDYYANVKGRQTHDDGSSPTAPEIIKDILSEELNQASILPDANDNYDNWRYAFCQNEKINSKQLIENLASVSPYIPRFDYQGNFKFDEIPLNPTSTTKNLDGTVSENHTIKDSEVIDFSFSRTPYEDIITKIEFKYNWDYAREEFLSTRILDVDTFTCYNVDEEGGIEGYNYDYYGFEYNSNGEGINHDERKLEIDDDRGKYIRDDATAERYMTWMLSWFSQQHLTMKIKLPLKYINLEIGDIINTDYILGGIFPYNIDYQIKSQDVAHYQTFLPFFIITGTNKTLDSVTIECTQMHYLWATTAVEVVNDVIKLLEPHGSDPTGCSYVYGCMDEGACNYDENAQLPNGTCWYPVGGCECEDGEGAELDFCGVCNGTNECGEDCDGNYEGQPEYGVVIDDCGVCGGPAFNTDWDGGNNIGLMCNCVDGIAMFWDDCGNCSYPDDYNSDMDECGICSGDGIPEGDCDCDGNVLDCNDECGGTAEIDECGICGGNNYNCQSANVDCECEAHIIMTNGPNAEILIDGGMNISLGLTNTSNGHAWTTLPDTVIDQNQGIIPLNCTALNPNNILFVFSSGFFPATNVTMEVKVAIHIDRIIAITLEDGSIIYSGTGEGEAGTCIDILGENASSPVPFFTATFTGDLSEGGYYDPSSQISGLEFDLFQEENFNGEIHQLNETVHFIAIYKIHLNISEVNIDPISEGTGTGITFSPTIANQQTYGWTFQNIPNTVCTTPLGDLNQDGGYNVLDIVTLTNCVLAGTDPGMDFHNCAELPNGCAGDMNGDGGYNVLDIVTLANCVLLENCCCMSNNCESVQSDACADETACNYETVNCASLENCDYGITCWNGVQVCDASDCDPVPCPTCEGGITVGMFYLHPELGTPDETWSQNDWSGSGWEYNVDCNTEFENSWSENNGGIISNPDILFPSDEVHEGAYSVQWWVVCEDYYGDKTLHKLYDPSQSTEFLFSNTVTGTDVCCAGGQP